MRLLPILGLLLGLTLRAAENPPAPAPGPAVMTPLQRMAFARVLIPADPGNRIQLRLPKSRVLSEGELSNTYREMQAGTYLGVVGWKDLMVNFALRSHYAEARVCLAQARKKEDFKTDSGLLDAWFLEQTGDARKAMAAYDELIAEFPSEVILQQRRAGCLAALYRPLAARQALEVVEAMAKDQDVWLEHMRGVVSLLENDLEEAHSHFVQSIRRADKNAYPHSAAGMALLYRTGASAEESVGWLKKALSGPDRRFHLLLINQEIWKPLWGEPSFQEAVASQRWPFFPEGMDAAALEDARTSGATQILSQNTLPEGYLAPLKLQEHQPGTRTRTLSGKLNLDLYKED